MSTDSEKHNSESRKTEKSSTDSGVLLKGESDAPSSEAFLHQELAENLGVVYFSLDSSLRYTYWNKASEEMTGISREKALGKSITEVFPETFGNKVIDFYHSCLDEQKAGFFENAFFMEGKKHYFEMHAVPHSKGLMVFARDVTDKKEAVLRSEQMQEKFSAILNNNQTSYTLIDRDYKITAFNSTAAQNGKMTFDKEMYVGQSIYDYVYPKDEENFKKDFGMALQGATVKIDRNFPLPDGDVIWFSFTYNPVFDQGEVSEVLLSVMDITERKKAGQALEEKEKKFRGIFDNAPLGIFLAFPDGNFQEVNPRFLEITNSTSFDKPSSLMSSISQLVEEKTSSLGMQATVGRQATIIQEEKVYSSGNEATYLNVFLQPIYNKAKRLVFWEGMVEDITKSKRDRQKIEQQNKDLQALNRDLDILLHSISHDLKSPLSSAMGLVYLLKGKPEPQEVENYLGMMDITLKKLDELIGDLLELSKEKRAGINIKRVDVGSVMDSVLDELQFVENSEKIEKSIVFEGGKFFYTDVRRLKIILSNLVSNAIRYHNIRQENPRITIKVKVDGEKAVFRVKDNGQGIPPEHANRIFEMFYRASESVKGSGLGLYLVKEMLEKMEGNISVNSDYGKGSTFKFSLPNARP